jgi:hypothetical protein
VTGQLFNVYCRIHLTELTSKVQPIVYGYRNVVNHSLTGITQLHRKCCNATKDGGAQMLLRIGGKMDQTNYQTSQQLQACFL